MLLKTKYPLHLDSNIFDLIRKAVAELGVEAYVIGGYVRDLILGRKSNDIDIVVLGSGIDLANHLALLIGNSTHVSIFKNFGTAMINYKGYEIEFVGARKESYRQDSRKPIVEEGTLTDDQNRRDFSINSIGISLSDSNFGELIDPFDGIKDIKDKRIVTPLNPDITFSDDPLRMMRAIRFASQLNFKIDPHTLEAIKKNKDRIQIVSQERISEELNKIILSPIPSVGFKHLFDTELLELIFPTMAELYGVEIIDGKGHKDNFYHTLKVLDNISENTDNLWLRWAAILHDIAKPATKRFEKKIGWTFHGHEDKGAQMVPTIFKKLKLPLDHKMKYVQKLVKLHLRPIALVKKTVTDSAVRRLLFEAGDDIDDLMTLCSADITTKNKKKLISYLNNFEIVKKKLISIEEKDKLRNWQPPISGELIMKTFNIPPSKEVGKIKNVIREAILEGEIDNNFENAFDFMLNLGRKMGLETKKIDQ